MSQRCLTCKRPYSKHPPFRSGLCQECYLMARPDRRENQDEEPNHLLPCPFCGQLDQVVEHTNSVNCYRCVAEVFDYDEDYIAHKRWNTRPSYDKEATQ